jgi:hypothetical protein
MATPDSMHESHLSELSVGPPWPCGGLGLRGLLACGPIGGAGFDGSGEPFKSLRDLGLCSLGSCSRQWPAVSDDPGIGVRSALRILGDVAVPSLAASTTLTRTSRSCTTTGAASAKSMTESIRRIRASVLYHRIFVGYVASIRRGDSGRSMKSKRRDTVQKKQKVDYKLEKVID